ncbi:MFS transporter [Atractiella rhizophila]|nr:MFS transporter [Atractiella rhizophila]
MSRHGSFTELLKRSYSLPRGVASRKMSTFTSKISFLRRRPLVAKEEAVIPELSVDDQKADDVEDIKEKESLEREVPGGSNERALETGERPTTTAQAGVQRVEAVTLTWSKESLTVVYISMFLLYFVNAFQSSITNNLTAYVLSDFSEHSLIPVIYIVSSTFSAVTYLPVSKLLDIVGRTEAFCSMVCLADLGLILLAFTNNVQTFCAAQVFYSVGFAGMIYSVDVITADTSRLKDRALAFAFTSSPYIITALAGPKAAEGFYEKISWRWAFGTFAIILPVVALPLVVVMRFQERKATKAGLIVQERSERTWTQSVWHYLIEFDAFGVLLLAAGVSLFLLPFSLADSAPHGWQSGYIIAMLVLGFSLMVTFAVFERYVAPKPFMPYHVLLSRTIAGTCLLCGTYQVAYYAWNSYFSSFLQVVNGLSISEAGYVGGIFDIIAGCYLLVLGFVIKKTGRFRIYLFIAGWIIFCQILLAFSGSTIILCEQVAVNASVDHQHISASLALLGLFGWLDNIGSAISGAIWTNTFPDALLRLLPEESLPDFESIYGDLTVQLSYPMGDPTREAIIESSVMGLSLLWVLLIKNIRLDKMEQMKGLLF